MLLNSLFLSALFAASSCASCLHGTSRQLRRLKRNGEVTISNFGYTGDKGPFSWAILSEANSACSTGKQQSPINVDASIARARTAPQMNIAAVAEAEFENLGSTIEVIMEQGELKTGNQTFALKQFHFHTPSEHRINEEYFPLEMHMVHEATDGSGAIAVMAVLFQLSEDATTTTELLTAVTENIEAIAEPGKVTKTGALDFAALTQHVTTTPLIEYAGSLTTPPCSEGPVFFITEQPMPLNVATFNAMKKTIKFNSRFTQNPIGRENIIETGAKGLEVAAAREGQADAPSATGEAASSSTTPAPAAPAEVADGGEAEGEDEGEDEEEAEGEADVPPAAQGNHTILTITEMAIGGRRVATSIIATVATPTKLA